MFDGSVDDLNLIVYSFYVVYVVQHSNELLTVLAFVSLVEFLRLMMSLTVLTGLLHSDAVLLCAYMQTQLKGFRNHVQ